MGVSSAGSFFVRQHIVGVGTDLVIIGGVFVGMDDGFVLRWIQLSIEIISFDRII